VFAEPCEVKNGGCEQICLPTTDITSDHAECDCKLGYFLQGDGKSCKTGRSWCLLLSQTNHVFYIFCFDL